MCVLRFRLLGVFAQVTPPGLVSLAMRKVEISPLAALSPLAEGSGSGFAAPGAEAFRHVEP